MSELSAPSLVLVSADPKRSIRRISGSQTQAAAVSAIAAEDLAFLPSTTIAVIDAEGLPPAAVMAAAERAQHHPDRTLILVPAAQSEALSGELAAVDGFRHVLAEPCRNLDFELTLARLCGAPEPQVQAYLPDTPFTEHELARGQDRSGALQLVEAAAEAHEIPGRLTEVALTFAEELITNALYNAPVDSSGAPLYRHLSRAAPLPNPVRPPGRFQVGCDGATLLIAVRDAFGSLPSDRLADDLRRMVQPKGHTAVDGDGGAGLGWVMAYRCVEHLHIDVALGRSTQIVGIIRLNGGYRRFVRAGHSFNLFISEGS